MTQQIHQVGDRILNGDYVVETFIGQGSFGQVYRVKHLLIGRSDTVKVLSKELQGVGTTAYEGYQRRFEQEYKFGGNLNHPNLVRVYDVREWEGHLYLVMEHCARGTLRDRLKATLEANQPVPILEAVRIGLDVAHGLAAIHAKSAVHRDLKPSNVFFDTRTRQRSATSVLCKFRAPPSIVLCSAMRRPLIRARTST